MAAYSSKKSANKSHLWMLIALVITIVSLATITLFLIVKRRGNTPQNPNDTASVDQFFPPNTRQSSPSLEEIAAAFQKESIGPYSTFGTLNGFRAVGLNGNPNTGLEIAHITFFDYGDEATAKQFMGLRATENLELEPPSSKYNNTPNGRALYGRGILERVWIMRRGQIVILSNLVNADRATYILDKLQNGK